ncbi:hypothetical protein Tco_1080824 [Tanacetum coccineum]|uniref:Integrase, catalytic region, zinc finger, CCHC-type, peptidase aspartic, catalytic n=1 Tax=Tanacetum coccineum TaxID=301880 RepID=A0ABQ5HX26_9ASTR
MARHCTQPKRPRNSAWFKEKLMLAEAQEAGQILDEEQLLFLANPRIEEAPPIAQQIIPQNLAFQTEDLDAYDSDCDDLSSAKAVLMENLSNCDSDVLSEVPYSDSYPNDMINQDVQEMQYSEQTHIDDFQDNEIYSDSNIISYSQYLQESQDAVIQDTNSSVPNDLLVLSLVEQLTDHVVKKRTTSDAITAGAWGFEHTKACFVTEIIPFSKVLKDTFNASGKTLLDEITKVQTVFNQMEAAVDQCSIDKNNLEIKIKQLSIDNDQLLNQIMSQDIVHIAINSIDILDMNKSCVDECHKCLKLKIELLKKKDFFKKEVYDKLVKSYSTLEKHCISLELETQLHQEIFQKDNSGENLNALTFNQLFKINKVKAQSQEKDTVIRKLKDRIKSLSGKENVENVKKDIDDIETINIELEHSVAKLLSENENLRKEQEHLKSIFKDQFDSIKKTHVQSKEYCDSLIAQINAKSVENSDLNAQLQEKVFAIATLKNELSKIKGKNVVDTAVSKPDATIAPGMFKLDIKPISYRLKNNRDVHEVYLDKTIEYTDTLRGIVECARKQNPSEPLLESACMFTKHVQELLVYASKTCLTSPNTNEKLVAVTPMNKDKKVRFDVPIISSNNLPKQTDSIKTTDSNKSLLTSTGVNTTTSASGSKPSSNTKKIGSRDHQVAMRRINARIKHSVTNAMFESMCAICNKCLFDANHDMCFIDYVNDVNVRSKSKSKRNKMRKEWKPTGNVFTKTRYSWKPTGRIFTIVGNRCPLTRIASTNDVPRKESTITPLITPSSEIKVYSRRPKASRSVGSSSKSTIIKSKTSNTKEPNQSWGSTVSDVPSSSLIDRKLSKLFCGTVRFGNDHIAKIMGYGDYQMGNVTISRVYYEEGLISK